MASYSNAAAGVNCSESTISTETVTGSHVLKIKRYSKTKEVLGVGESIKSSVFTVGGHRWYIEFYPHGYNEEEDDCISFVLFLDHPDDDETSVKAKFWLILLDQAGEPVPGYSAAMGLCTFSGAVPSYGCERFIVREELEAAPYLKDDSFSLRCDVTVFKEIRHGELLLHSIYTDTLPEIAGGDKLGMAKDLLVAADRYRMQKLKLICENTLHGYVHASTVLAFSGLAEKYGCKGLREACFKFLKVPGNLRKFIESDGFE
uniref:MATH domain-containing protein n=1 Tax=Setaria italica TaxID=4555 RepID=K3ZNL4_SETIT